MERDLAVFGYIFAMENFNSHAHVERDGGEIQLRDQDGNFNSHAHVERDLCEDRGAMTIHDFNSHAHVERDFTCTILI